MDAAAKESHLADLFLRAGNKLGKRARWINYHRGWCHQLVGGGFYERIRDLLEGALAR